ncbi:unnamed protein product, partial [Cyprideis torosa]
YPSPTFSLDAFIPQHKSSLPVPVFLSTLVHGPSSLVLESQLFTSSVLNAILVCCNDVVNERFAPELKYEVALRLGALHIQQHALSHQFQSKVTVKAIEREFGLERFVPHSLLETMKRKELRKLLSHFLKQVQTLSAPGQKQLSALQAKLHYLSIIAQLPSYGAKCFPMNLKASGSVSVLWSHDGNLETVVLVSPRFGVSQISPMRNSMDV